MEATKTCSACGKDALLSDYLNPQSGRERDHCRECWKKRTRAAADERRAQAKLRREATPAPQKPIVPSACPRCGCTFAYTDEDGDLVCKDCNSLLVSYSNYRREVAQYEKMQRTKIRGLGRPKKGEVYVKGVIYGPLRQRMVLNSGSVYIPTPVNLSSRTVTS